MDGMENVASKYVLVSQVGIGSFATVFQAYHVDDKRPVALKMIQKCKLVDADYLERVVAEHSIHRVLQHPNIVQFIGAWEDSNVVCFVLEFCEKGDLGRFLSEHGHLEKQLVLSFIAQLAAAVKHLHRLGIVHGDIKPSNLLQHVDGTLKLGDFGLARMLSGSPSVSLRSHKFCGTPNFAAPEVARGEAIGTATDMWSVGCVLFTLLTGAPPFEVPGQHNSVEATLGRVSRASYVMPASVPDVAADLIRQLLVLDPAKRLTIDQLLVHPFMMTAEPSVSGTPRPILSETPRLLSTTTSRFNGTSPSMTTLLKPLNTAQLPQTSHRTRSSIVQIDGTGAVTLETLGSEPRFLTISGDGLQITARTSTGTVQHFDFAALPDTLHKRYQYACRFVSLVQQRVPLIRCRTSRASCVLMRSGDFLAQFHDGARVHLSGADIVSATDISHMTETQRLRERCYAESAKQSVTSWWCAKVGWVIGNTTKRATILLNDGRRMDLSADRLVVTDNRGSKLTWSRADLSGLTVDLADSLHIVCAAERQRLTS
eukprot:TRINITY_DN9260_c0_g1_i1.p1 TRINITY_DN9260_c0_g1~~TRINITY_DN9260_c0_g1_i1.p1  ORF type:complete len:541 (-),score=93.97 TRINITY_DN9260_c0_g1_i1:141-1763(-)